MPSGDVGRYPRVRICPLARLASCIPLEPSGSLRGAGKDAKGTAARLLITSTFPERSEAVQSDAVGRLSLDRKRGCVRLTVRMGAGETHPAEDRPATRGATSTSTLTLASTTPTLLRPMVLRSRRQARRGRRVELGGGPWVRTSCVSACGSQSSDMMIAPMMALCVGVFTRVSTALLPSFGRDRSRGRG